MGILESIGALLFAGALAWFAGRRAGGKAATDKMVKKDRDNADKIRTAADRARAADDAGSVDAVDRVQRHGRLRD
jgi:hypothetical protein